MRVRVFTIPSCASFALAVGLSLHAAPQEKTTPDPLRFNGAWKYNEQESINTLTGKPERSSVPMGGQGVLQSGDKGSGGATPPDPGSGRITQCIGCQGTSDGDPRIGMVIVAANDAAAKAGAGRPEYIQPPSAEEKLAMEAHALVRDLTEIAETLTLDSTRAALTITDDLGHTDTFPANGKKQSHHVSASSFDVTSRWNGPQFEQTLTGAQGFKMTRVFLTSSDGERLFVLFRIGDSRVTKVDMPRTTGIVGGQRASGGGAHTEGVAAAGANRVYDRVK